MPLVILGSNHVTIFVRYTSANYANYWAHIVLVPQAILVPEAPT